MGKRKIDIDNEVQKILNSTSLGADVKPSPFFTTRVMGKIEQIEPIRNYIINWNIILKPAIAAIILINVFNFWLLISDSNTVAETQANNVDELLDDYSYDITASAIDSYDEYYAMQMQ